MRPSNGPVAPRPSRSGWPWRPRRSSASPHDADPSHSITRSSRPPRAASRRVDLASSSVIEVTGDLPVEVSTDRRGLREDHRAPHDHQPADRSPTSTTRRTSSRSASRRDRRENTLPVTGNPGSTATGRNLPRARVRAASSSSRPGAGDEDLQAAVLPGLGRDHDRLGDDRSVDVAVPPPSGPLRRPRPRGEESDRTKLESPGAGTPRHRDRRIRGRATSGGRIDDAVVGRHRGGPADLVRGGFGCTRRTSSVPISIPMRMNPFCSTSRA